MKEFYFNEKQEGKRMIVGYVTKKNLSDAIVTVRKMLEGSV